MGLLEDLASQLPPEVLGKYNIGADGKMQLSERMQEAYNFPETKFKLLEKRSITMYEYEYLPKESKAGIGQVFKFETVFSLAIMLIMMIVFILILLNDSSDTFPWPVLIIEGVILAGIIFKVLGAYNNGIKPNSEVVEGEVFSLHTRITKGANDSHISYYATVALFDQKKLVKDVRCDRDTYKILKPEQKVYICKNKVYAAK